MKQTKSSSDVLLGYRVVKGQNTHFSNYITTLNTLIKYTECIYIYVMCDVCNMCEIKHALGCTWAVYRDQTLEMYITSLGRIEQIIYTRLTMQRCTLRLHGDEIARQFVSTF